MSAARCSVVAAILLAGCAGRIDAAFRGEGGAGGAPVAVAPPIFLADLAQAPAGDEALWAGTYVGQVLFSGGFVVEERDGALENRSGAIELGEQARYRAQVAELVGRCVGEALGREGRDWLAAAPVDPGGWPAPRRRDLRGSGPLDGRDNQALPRFELSPAPWPEAPVPDGAVGLLVPVIVHYYAHNGGWFLGQTYGSASGARARVLWARHAPDGAVEAWGEHEVRVEEHGVFSPNRAQVQDLLIDAEERLCRELRRRVR